MSSARKGVLDILSPTLRPNSATATGVLLLSCAYFLSVGWNVQLQPVENPDEPRYACPARDMVGSSSLHDWVVPEFNGAPRLVKPILLYWLLAAAGLAGQALGKELSTAFRLVPLLAGWLTVLAAYGLGRRLYNPRVGLLSGGILATTYYFHQTTRQILIDPLLTALLAGAWYFFVCALERLARARESTPWAPLCGFYLCLGLACLAKGPVLVAAFAVLPMAAYLIWERRRYLPPQGQGGGALRWVLARAGLAWGLPLALGVGFSWGLLLWREGQGEAALNFLWRENFERAAGLVDHNKGLQRLPLLWYLVDLPGRFLPWILFAVPALAVWWREGGPSRPASKLLCCACVIPLLVLGLAASKRSLYLLPLYPLLAVWIAWAWERIFLRRAGFVECAWGEGAPDASKPDARSVRKGESISSPSRLETVWSILLGAVGVLAALGAAALHVILLREPGGLGSSYGLGEKIMAGAGNFALCVGAAMLIRDLVAKRLGQASFQALALVAALGLLYEASLQPARWREEHRAAGYAELGEAVGARPLIWLGGKCSEAVWYLKRTVPNARRCENLGVLFFRVPEARLLVRDREWQASAPLRAAARELRSWKLKDETYRLVAAEPGRTPDPLFFRGAQAEEGGGGDER